MSRAKHPNVLAASMAGAASLVTGLTYLVLLGDKETILLLAGKERVLEGVGALLFLLSSILCCVSFLRARRAPQGHSRARHIIYLLLSIFFFVAFGEELSWGQHIFEFETPERIARINEQEELNIHNLTLFDSYEEGGRKRGLAFLFTSNRLFDYFMIAVFIAVPAARRHRRLDRWLARREIPVLPAALSLPLVLNFILTAIGEVWLVEEKYQHLAVSEIREFNYAFLCVMGIVFLYWKERRGTGESRSIG